jgi:putative oxidoreductase
MVDEAISSHGGVRVYLFGKRRPIVATDPSIRSQDEAASRMMRRYRIIDTRISDELRRTSVPLLRGAIGLVFVWFGALKVMGVTPVGDFVAGTLPWFDRGWLIPALGLFEIAIGLGVIVGRFVVLVCALLVGHLGGTFLALVMQSDVTFQSGNPLVLTTEGEFVVKNLVFVAAGLVIAAQFDRRRNRTE